MYRLWYVSYNYKKKPVYTFNSQLADTRSTYDKRQTLLHYIAHVVEKLYPHQLSFYDDLDIDEAAKGEEV